MHDEVNPILNIIGLMMTSIKFVEASSDEKNKEKTVSELYEKHKYSKIVGAYNPALLIAASYIMLLYPKEAFKKNTTNSENKLSEEDKKTAEHIRHSLAHADFEINDKNEIVFKDSKFGRKDLNMTFEKLGEFISKYYESTYEVFKKP